jgi:tRNA pseudouridine55 synthase
VADADPSVVLPLETALGFLPRVALEGEAARRAGHGQTVAGEPPGGAAGEVLLVDADGPIAIAEPRPGAQLKPIVGFRA